MDHRKRRDLGDGDVGYARGSIISGVREKKQSLTWKKGKITDWFPRDHFMIYHVTQV